MVGCGQKRSFYPAFETSTEEPGDDDAGDDCTHNVEKKRRLTFDQVRSLERNFELENKLEPERKMQLAKELGLQPRQVAVWFQNRRARWKTKQLERDYEVLTLDYNRLKTEFDAVVQEKQELQAEVSSENSSLDLLRLAYVDATAFRLIWFLSVGDIMQQISTNYQPQSSPVTCLTCV